MIAPLSLAGPQAGDAIRVSALAKWFSKRYAMTLLAPDMPSGQGPLSGVDFERWDLSVRRNSAGRTALRSMIFRLPYDTSRFTYDIRDRTPKGATYDVVYINLGLGWDVWKKLRGEVRARCIVCDLQNDDPDMWAQRASTEGSRLIRTVSRVYATRAKDKFSQIARQADLVLCVSEEDRAQLLSRGLIESKRVRVVPNGVDPDTFRRPSLGPRSKRFVFIGSLNARMNQVAVRGLFSIFWPAVRASYPDADLVVVGRNPPEWMKRSGKAMGVSVISSPPDIRPYLWEATALLAPFPTGGGTKIKILEAMASGTPVLATPAAMQGIGAEPDRDFIAFTSPGELADACYRLLTKGGLSEQLSVNGRRFVSRFDWESLVATADDAIQECLARVNEAVPLHAVKEMSASG